MLKEVDIFDRGKLSLDELFSDRLIFEDTLWESSTNKNRDGELLINGKKFNFEVIIRPSVSKINKYIFEYNVKPESYILVFDSVSEEVANYCRDKGINYLDSAGNAYINTKNTLVYIEGRQDNKYKESTKRVFQKTGLKLVFELLRNPMLSNEPYRIISDYVGISPASVGNFIEELEDDNFLIDIRGEKRLNDIERLIMKWVFSYNEILKPKLHRGYFKLVSEKSLEALIENSNKDKVYFSGEYGAFFLNNKSYLKPNNLILYTDMRLSTLAKKYRLVPINQPRESDVKVELVEPFWNTNYITEQDINTYNINIRPLIVNTVLIYADLLDSKNSRNIEVAEKIFKNEIRDRFF